MIKCNRIWKSSILLTFLMFFASNSIAAELKAGRYIGWIHFPERNEKLAVVAEFILKSPNDLKKFPVMLAIFKFSLGGYGTREYFTEQFHELRYDYDGVGLTLDEPQNDHVINAHITVSGGRTRLQGDVLVRSNAKRGNLVLVEESDEPDGDEQPPSQDSTFVPLLDGQYRGRCQGWDSVLQIQTAHDPASSEKVGLNSAYRITGRLGFKSDPLCDGRADGLWCFRRHFISATFNIFDGRLHLKGENSSDICTLSQGEVLCRFIGLGDQSLCRFEKAESILEPRFHTRNFHLRPSRDQLTALPHPSPPQNAELSKTLNGRFAGYVHNETNDTYLPLQLDVLSSSYTDNPHNPNQIMISSVASLHLGPDGQFVVQRFEPTSFYLRPGFVLSDSGSDAFLSISDWRQGFIRGVWYSRSFGRVGTVQLLKISAPTAPSDALLVPSFAGEFSRESRRVRFDFPVDPTSLHGHLIRFTGTYQAISGNTPIRELEFGYFDPYTSNLSYTFKHGEKFMIGTGRFDAAGKPHLYWPPLPVVGSAGDNYVQQPFFRRQGTP